MKTAIEQAIEQISDLRDKNYGNGEYYSGKETGCDNAILILENLLCAEAENLNNHAIGFAEWIRLNAYYSGSNLWWHYKNKKDSTIIELLEIYNQQQNTNNDSQIK